MTDDTEWEPIETQSSVVEPIKSSTTVLLQELSVLEWPELIMKVTTSAKVPLF
jgi:hypothetical protein